MSESKQVIGDSLELSAGRVGKIYQGYMADPALAEFIDSVKHGLAPAAEQISAAKDCIAKIRLRLLPKTGKGREMRAKVAVVGFGQVGKSALQEENFDDVEALRSMGMSLKDALAIVANANDQTVPAVKSDHQRIKSLRVRDLDAVVKITNKGGAIIDQRSETVVQVLPQVTRCQVKLEKF
jgi:hypothetical protein